MAPKPQFVSTVCLSGDDSTFCGVNDPSLQPGPNELQSVFRKALKTQGIRERSHAQQGGILRAVRLKCSNALFAMVAKGVAL
jgi:hypothetical protein